MREKEGARESRLQLTEREESAPGSSLPVSVSEERRRDAHQSTPRGSL